MAIIGRAFLALRSSYTYWVEQIGPVLNKNSATAVGIEDDKLHWAEASDVSIFLVLAVRHLAGCSSLGYNKVGAPARPWATIVHQCCSVACLAPGFYARTSSAWTRDPPGVVSALWALIVQIWRCVNLCAILQGQSELTRRGLND